MLNSGITLESIREGIKRYNDLLPTLAQAACEMARVFSTAKKFDKEISQGAKIARRFMLEDSKEGFHPPQHPMCGFQEKAYHGMAKDWDKKKNESFK